MASPYSPVQDIFRIPLLNPTIKPGSFYRKRERAATPAQNSVSPQGALADMMHTVPPPNGYSAARNRPGVNYKYELSDMYNAAQGIPDANVRREPASLDALTSFADQLKSYNANIAERDRMLANAPRPAVQSEQSKLAEALSTPVSIDPNWKSVWDRGTGDRGFELASRNPTSLRPFPAAMLAPPREPATQYTLANPPRLGTSKANRDSRGYSAADLDKFALRRARAGMSLNNDEQLALEGMAAQSPGGLASLLAGSRAEQRANAKATVRQRGMARGAARAAGETASAAMRAGAPRGLAALYALPGGAMNDPAALNMAGVIGSDMAEAMMRSANDKERNMLQRETMQMAPQIAAMQSEDPLLRRQAAAALGFSPAGQGMGDGSLPAAVDASGNPVADLQLTNEDVMALQDINKNMGGSPEMIAQYGRRQKWSGAKIAAATRRYGPTALESLLDSAYQKAGEAFKPIGMSPEGAALNLNPMLTGGVPFGGSIYDWLRRNVK